jgi:hypothetical protein
MQVERGWALLEGWSCAACSCGLCVQAIDTKNIPEATVLVAAARAEALGD